MKNTVLLIGVMATFFLFTGFALAQSYVPLAPLPFGAGGAESQTYTLSTYLGGMLKLLIALGAGISILVAIVGGVQYVAAGIAPSAKQDAKERITNSLIGLALVLTSYLILNSINPKLVQFSFMLPPVGSAPLRAPTTGSGVHVPVVRETTPTTEQSAISATVENTNDATINPPVENTPQPLYGNISVDDLSAMVQNTFNTYINLNNDYSIINHCFGNTTEPFCNGTDLNDDGGTDTEDVSLFNTKTYPLDVNGNRTLELSDGPTARSCFFKISTATLPHAVSSPQNFASLGSVCAADSGYLTIPFGFVYGADGDYPGVAGEDGQYSNFQIWINSSLSGSVVNLQSLLQKTFYNRQDTDYDGNTIYNQYHPNTLGKITYATISQYDLNDDGLADFGAGGADMIVFNSCKTLPISGVCAQANFNGDEVVDDRDLAFANDLFGGPGLAFGWKLDWFESRFFDQTGYSDKQIINYCIGHKAFEKCGGSDFDGDGVVNAVDLTAFNDSATPLDFNGDGKVDLTIPFVAVATPATASQPVTSTGGSTPAVILDASNDPGCPSGYTYTVVPITWEQQISIAGPLHTMNHCEVKAFQFTMPNRSEPVQSQTSYATVPKYLSLSQTTYDFSSSLEASGCATTGQNNPIIWNTTGTPMEGVCTTTAGATYYLNVRNASSRVGQDNCPTGNTCTFYLAW